MSLRYCYHEAGHALIARDLGRKVESLAASAVGGAVREEALAPNGTEEEIRRGLLVVFAGREGEKYAPLDRPAKAEENGHVSVGELEALSLTHLALESAPSDEAVIAHYTERIGREAVEEARELAVELVARKAATGTLERLADELSWRGVITGDELEVILAPAA